MAVPAHSLAREEGGKGRSERKMATIAGGDLRRDTRLLGPENGFDVYRHDTGGFGCDNAG
jgi:hypothetical protein